MSKKNSQHKPVGPDDYLEVVNIDGMSSRDIAEHVMEQVRVAESDGEYLVPFMLSIHEESDPDATWRWDIDLYFPRTGESVSIRADHISDREDAEHKATIIGLLLFNLFDAHANSASIADLLLALERDER